MFVGRWSSTQCSAYDAASAARPQIVQEAPGAKNQKLPVQPVRRLGSQWQSFRWRSDGDSLRLARGFAFAQVECPKNRSLKDYLIWKFAVQGQLLLFLQLRHVIHILHLSIKNLDFFGTSSRTRNSAWFWPSIHICMSYPGSVQNMLKKGCAGVGMCSGPSLACAILSCLFMCFPFI